MPLTRMTAQQRREQVLSVAELEFATRGLHGASTETIAHGAGITQTYVFRLFSTKRELFLACVDAAFERLTLALRAAAADATGVDALAAMGREYNAMLADRTTLLLQLQGMAAAAAGEPEIRDAVRASFGRLWQAVSDTAGLDPVTIKTFLAFGMLLNTSAALGLADVDERWARQARTRIKPGLFEHVTRETNR
jgi:AcrR family transcriptional regulator